MGSTYKNIGKSAPVVAFEGLVHIEFRPSELCKEIKN
jgi:hypothetical protein